MIRILIVEDDEDFSAILRRALEQDPELKVIEVVNTEQCARDWMRSPKLAECDCVLLDLQLPHSAGDKTVNSMAGLRLLEELRQAQRFYGTVLILTNSKAPADGQRALAGGCDGYLCKRARISEVPEMLSQLKMAIKGDVMLFSVQMRHVFLREDISAKEARLMDLLSEGKSWAEISRTLGYKTPKAAANIGDRIYDKLLTPQDQERLSAEGLKKRHLAVEIWQSRHR